MREYDMCHFEMEHFRARRNKAVVATSPDAPS